MESQSQFSVALVSPPYGHAMEAMEPLGLIALKVYLDSVFQTKIRVEIFDFSSCDSEDYSLLHQFSISNYNLVGFCAYSTNFPIVLKWARRLKLYNSDCLTVIGGPHTTSMSEHIAMIHSKEFDYVIRGEGEIVLANLVECLRNNVFSPKLPGLTYKTKLGPLVTTYMDPPKDLDLLPSPVAKVTSPSKKKITYYDKKDQKLRSAIAFTSSRGCPFRCSFCSISSTETKWRSASADSISIWIQHANEMLGEPFEHIYFMDADFMIRKDRVMDIGRMFAKSYPELTWSISGRVDDLLRLGEDNLRVLTHQGLRFIECGLESGSQASLDRMNKQVTVQNNYEAIDLLRKVGLQITVDFILFLPDTTPEHLKENLEFILNAGLSEHMPNDFYFTYLLLYPSTPLRTFYENLLNIKLDLDELPEPDNLFVHQSTKQIFKLFVRDFRSYRIKIGDALEKIELLLASNPSVEFAQRLRIESISLRHIPFLVLDQLIISWSEGDLLKSVPWLASFEQYIFDIESMCNCIEVAA